MMIQAYSAFQTRILAEKQSNWRGPSEKKGVGIFSLRDVGDLFCLFKAILGKDSNLITGRILQPYRFRRSGRMAATA
jgi:hypothetical protein